MCLCLPKPPVPTQTQRSIENFPIGDLERERMPYAVIQARQQALTCRLGRGLARHPRDCVNAAAAQLACPPQ